MKEQLCSNRSFAVTYVIQFDFRPDLELSVRFLPILSFAGFLLKNLPKMVFTEEMKLDVVEFFYSNGKSWTATRRAMQREYPKHRYHIHMKTIQRIITKFERDLTLKKTKRGGPKNTVVITKNVRKVDEILSKSPNRSVRNIAKRTSLTKSSVWVILRKELEKFPYKIQMEQAQTKENKEKRMEFAKNFHLK